MIMDMIANQNNLMATKDKVQGVLQYTNTQATLYFTQTTGN